MSSSANWLVSEPDFPFATYVFAHGAGAPMDSEFMQIIADGLTAHSVRVIRFEFPYMAARRLDGKKRPPDRMPKLQDCWQHTVDKVWEAYPHQPVFIGGKSMGGRAAVMSAGAIAPSGVLCLGYPFYAAGKGEALNPDSPRFTPLVGLTCPTLIIQGERDALGDHGHVSALPMPETVSVVWTPDGDHSLKPRKSSGYTYDAALLNTVEMMVAFMRLQS
jgi:predicted alpha/beta-hydrolase family hydrolase